jgi:phosphoribosylamine--glycine ligase
LAQASALDGKTAALAYLAQAAFPVVVKASGLAAGKGVIICQLLISIICFGPLFKL